MTAVATLEDRYTEVNQRAAEAAERSGRRASDVIVVAVTKAAEPEQIRQLIEIGHRDFGENRIQQLVQRVGMVEEYFERMRVLSHTRSARETGVAGILGNPGGDQDQIRWHMIGHLQRNKARKAVDCCRLIQSVDSLRVAEELQAIGFKKDIDIEVLLQVNCSGEDTKYGCPVPAAKALDEQIDLMGHVRLRGMMTMAEQSDKPDVARLTFGRGRELFEEVAKLGVGDGRFNLLSMGMSGDYQVAIEEGANIVRVGSAIFREPQ